jgi:uncharacterized protein (TIGR00255 family)
MILSMTGFASSERDTINGVLIVELRSVNHRYLELQLKLDDGVRNFEPLIRELIAARLGRGKVECRLSLVRRQNAEQQTRLDQNALQQLAQLSAAVQQQFPQCQALSMADILRWPGVLVSDGTTLDEQALAQDIQASLEQTLQQMTEARAREGGKLKQLILERLASMETRVAQVKPLLPAQLQAYQQRLAAKLQEAVSHVDADRLTQELTLFAQRIDVDEELTRLGAHMQEVRRILDADGMAGKRLDFLMQELNREANTLGSKSVSTEVTQAAMALKVLIEQMREQIQNIE